MLKQIIALALFLISLNIVAEEGNQKDYKCTEWTARRSVTCIFAGSRASIFERQCENPCWRSPRTHTGNWGPNCDMEKVCSRQNPSDFRDVCSEWVRERSISCRNPNTNRWESSWKRVCTVGLKEQWCSNNNPNNL